MLKVYDPTECRRLVGNVNFSQFFFYKSGPERDSKCRNSLI